MRSSPHGILGAPRAERPWGLHVLAKERGLLEPQKDPHLPTCLHVTAEPPIVTSDAVVFSLPF